MTWRSLPWSLLVLCTCGWSGMAAKPNILFIVLDDAGWADFQSMDPNMRTPNIDQLRQEGLFLNQSYVLPICAPTRVAYLTGRYPHTFGLQDVNAVGLKRLSWVNETFRLLPQEMKELGYTTHMLGKWHLGHCHPSLTPLGRGFDTFYGMQLGGHSSHYTHLKLSGFGPYDWYDGNRVDWSAMGQYSTDLLNDRMVDIIERTSSNSSQPFFAYLAYFAPHSPFEAPYHYVVKYCSHVTERARRIHCAMMAAVDEGIGRIIAALKAKGMYDNTVMIVTSDNGGPIMTDNTVSGSSNYPLRGGKKSVYEGGTRSYTVLKAPNLDVTGTTWSGMIHAIDWMPTILGMAGGQPKNWMHGMDMREHLQRFRPSPRSEFLYTYDDYFRFMHSAYRVHSWKLIRYPPYNLIKNGTAEWELVDNTYLPTDVELYNIDRDPDERINLAEQRPDKVIEVLERLNIFLTQHPLQPFREPRVAPVFKDRRTNTILPCFCRPPGSKPCY